MLQFIKISLKSKYQFQRQLNAMGVCHSFPYPANPNTKCNSKLLHTA